MGTANPGDFTGIKGAFPGKQGEDLAKEFEDAYSLFKKNEVESACTRLNRLDDDVKTHASSLDLLLRYIPDIGVFIDDIEEAYAGSVRRRNLGRTLLALAPLLLTWVSLSVATWSYKGEPPQTNPTVTQTIHSFLAQWQSGFDWPWPLSLFTFSVVAALDFLLIGGVVAFTVSVHNAEARPKEIIKEVESSIEQAIRSLLIAIEQRGAVNPASAPSLVRDSARMMSNAVHELEKAADKWSSAATKTETTVRDIGTDTAKTLNTIRDEIKEHLEKTHSEIQSVLKTLKEDIEQVIRDEMGAILRDYRETLGEFQEQVREYKEASIELVGEAKKISTAGGILAAEATAYTGIARDIDTHMVELKTSHNDFVGKVDSIVKDMRTSATDMTTIVDKIDKTLQPELRILVREAASTSVALTTASGSLQTTTNQLVDTTRELRRASGDLDGAIKGLNPSGFSSGNSGVGRWLLIGVGLIGFQTFLFLLMALGIRL